MLFGLIERLLKLPWVCHPVGLFMVSLFISRIELGGPLKCSLDLTEAGEERRLQLSELEEIRVEAYESARSYKEGVKLFHDKYILRKEFALG